MTPTRAAALLTAAVLVAGCSRPQPPPPAAGKSGEPAPTGDPKADAAAFAKHFLKAVSDGTATPAMLTPEFKKVIAEPVFADDQAKGYSDDAAGQWLLRFKGLPPLEMTGPVVVGDAALVIAGRADEQAALTGRPDPSQIHAALRVVRSGGGYLIDWFFPAAVNPAGTYVVTGQPAATGFAASAFLDAVCGKDDRLAEGLMTPRYKAALAPPLPSDKRGYNRGLLGNKLADLRGNFPGYNLSQPAEGTVSGALVKPGERDPGAARKPFTLKLVKGDRPWDWLVDEFKAE
jgi:hypothetical protein